MLYFNCGHSSVNPGQLRDNNNNNNDNFSVVCLLKKRKKEKLGQRWAKRVGGQRRRRQVHEPAQMACTAVRAAPLPPLCKPSTPHCSGRASGERPVPAKFCFPIFWLSPSCVVLISIARHQHTHFSTINGHSNVVKGGSGSGATDTAKLGFVLWPVLCRPSGTRKLPLLRALLNCAKV